jgi:cytoskeleton protein RodZ
LSISFSGDCWTEVSDVSGKRLYFDLGSEGRSATITGAAPLRALFGDSNNVRLAVNGQDYPITDSMRSGRTARMSINAQ